MNAKDRFGNVCVLTLSLCLGAVFMHAKDSAAQPAPGCTSTATNSVHYDTQTCAQSQASFDANKLTMTHFTSKCAPPTKLTSVINASCQNAPIPGFPTGSLWTATACCTAPSYDIKLLKAATPLGSSTYMITLINAGAPITGPATITVKDDVPLGMKVTGGQGSGPPWWSSINPALPQSGPMTLTLSYTIPAGTTVPTGGQIAWFKFFTQPSGKNCATATQLLVNGQVVPDTNTGNNAACAP